MLLPFVVFVSPKACVVGYVTNPLHVDDTLHRRSICGDGHEIVTLGNSGSCPLSAKAAAAPAATTSTALGSARRSFSRSEIDLARQLSAQSSWTATAAARAAPSSLRLHALAQRTHSGGVTALTHCIHRIANAAPRGSIHAGKISARCGCVSANGSE